MPVAVTAAASAIARPRCADEGHRRLGASITPAQRGGGDLTDAVAGDRADHRRACVRAREERDGRTARPAATSSGWATAVSRISSASASVP